MSTPPEPSLDERVVEAAVGHLEIMGMYLGRRLGLYEAMAAVGPLTSAELSQRAGIDERYSREWLEQQALAGYVTADGGDGGHGGDRRYRLSDEQRAVLVDATHPAHVAPLASMTMGIASVIDDVVQAYRTGAGVPYSAYGADFRIGQGGINRPAFTNDLVSTWIPAVPEAHEALVSGRPVRVVDVGTGEGWAAIAVAAAYPEAEVIGIDSDAASIADARLNAEGQGVNVTFRELDAAALDTGAPIHLALILEVLHDMPQPTAALRTLRRAMADDGVVIVADEAVAEEFSAPGELLERMMYGWSITACLPASLAEPGSEGIGTVIRPATVERIATEAGFRSFEILDVDGGFFRLYALRP